MFGQSLLSAFGIACTTDTDQLFGTANSVAYYKMSDATDQLGNYNGTATNVNFNTEGKFGFAGAFNGSSSNVEFSAGSFNNTTISVSAWINSASSAADQSIFNDFDYDGSTSRGFIWRKNANNTLTAQFYNSGTQRNLNTTATVANNVWTNVVLTISSTEANIYINNGTPVTLTQNNLINFHSTTKAGIGSYRFTGGSFQQFFNGSIDQIRIYNSALSAANVTSLYNEIECPAVAVTNAFNTVLWTGDGISGRAIPVGFQPDMSWYKSRNNAYDHNLSDSVRGAQKQIRPNRDIAEVSATDQITAFTSTGLTLGNGGDANGGSNQTYVAWNWKASATTVTNTDGTTGNNDGRGTAVDSQVRANQTSGFSIAKFTLPTDGTANYGHGLLGTPDLVIYKRIDGTSPWMVFSNLFGANKYFRGLNTTGALVTTSCNVFNAGETTVGIGNTSCFNEGSGQNWITYNFQSIDGFSRVGSYIGDGQATKDIFTGFQVSFVIIKAKNAATGWVMYNSSMGRDYGLEANTSGSQFYTANLINFLADGFSVTNKNHENTSNKDYIFLAIA